MIIRSVEFVTSAVHKEGYPVDNLPEIVLSGRSNVGKSSFINSILNRKNFAYTSSQPGKTQTLNFFKINEAFYFVDVPGYGYAKVSKADRQKFGEIIEEYLVYRKELSLLVQLVDFRHAPSEDDVIMYNYLKNYNIPVLVIGTKLDKVAKTQRPKHIKLIKNTLKMDSNDIFVPYSSETKENIDIVFGILAQYI